MTLSDRLIRYIQNHHPITLDRLISVAQSRGFTELEVLTALDTVHKDRRITVTNLKAGVTYRPTAPKAVKEPGSHLTWLRNNYPAMDETNDGSGIDIDLSWMFLKTREERDAYKAAVSGRPVYNKTNGRQGKRGTKVNS